MWRFGHTVQYELLNYVKVCCQIYSVLVKDETTMPCTEVIIHAAGRENIEG